MIEGDPNVYTTAGVSSISSYSDATPAGSTVREGVLGSVDVTLSERLHPLDGTCSGAAARVATERKRVLRALALRLDALTGEQRARC